MANIDVCDEAAVHCLNYLLELLPTKLQAPRTGIICGSGLGGLADQVSPDSRVEIPYKDIPHFVQSTGIYQVN